MHKPNAEIGLSPSISGVNDAPNILVCKYILPQARWHSWAEGGQPSDVLVLVQKNPIEDSQRFVRVCQFAGHQVNADDVSAAERQDDGEDADGAGRGLGPDHRPILQPLGLEAPGVDPRQPRVGLGQDSFDALVAMAGQNGADEVTAVKWHGEYTWTGEGRERLWWKNLQR